MTYETRAWVDHEFDTVELGDERLNRRFKLIATQLARHCGKTLASSFTPWKAIKASYRFFANKRFNEQQMLAPHRAQTLERIRAHDTVLLVQDSTYLDYNNRPKTEGLDFTFRSKFSIASQGLILHNTLAITDHGIPLGLVDQTFVERKSFVSDSHATSRKKRHWNRPVEEKESRRWIDVIRQCHQLDFGQTQKIHLADRECDLYEFFRDAVELGENVLVRAARNRAINKTKRREPPTVLLFDHLKAKKAQGKVAVTVQVNSKKKYRQAELSIVYCPITMPPPANKTVKKDGANLPIVPLVAILAVERRPPKQQQPVCWALLTNMAVDTLEHAIEKVQWYALRWHIEVFHKILKSGCGVEQAQLRHADRLKKYIVLKSIIAWRLFWLARAHEHNKDGCCTSVLADIEWKVLYRKIHKTSRQPTKPPTLGEVLVWIAKLGGYIGRTSDPPPGIISLWRGWQRLTDMVDDFNDIYG